MTKRKKRFHLSIADSARINGIRVDSNFTRSVRMCLVIAKTKKFDFYDNKFTRSLFGRK